MRTVTATAYGRAQGTPDLLTARVGISNTGTAAGDVMAENNRLAQALLDRVAELSVAEGDCATASIDLHHEYDREGQISGYRATNMLTITLRDLTAAGEQLDALIRAGGDAARLEGISLDFADADGLLSTARVDGVRRARAQAAEMAEALGANLGDVVSITDAVLDHDPGPRPVARMVAMAAMPEKVPVAAGSRELTVRVRVVFELT